MKLFTKHRNNKISETVDNTLKKIFGNEATHLIYTYLENNYSLRQNEIDEKIELFAKGLEEFLRTGAYVIEMKILEDIYSRHGLTFGPELERRQDFVSHMKVLRTI